MCLYHTSIMSEGMARSRHHRPHQGHETPSFITYALGHVVLQTPVSI